MWLEPPAWLQGAPIQIGRVSVDIASPSAIGDSLLFAIFHLSLGGRLSFDLASNFFFITTCTFCCLQPVVCSFKFFSFLFTFDLFYFSLHSLI